MHFLHEQIFNKAEWFYFYFHYLTIF
jgi:hypothetical protein